MKLKSRFVASVVKTSKQEMPALPFHRGAQRTEFILKRSDKTLQVRSA